MIKLSDVCAGIVLYNPDMDRIVAVINSIKDQVKELYLVDNGSECVSQIRELVDSIVGVYLIENSENEGIAKALNQICQKGIEQGFHWAITLDQDTICPANLVERLTQFVNKENVGIICPAVDYEGIELKTPEDGRVFEEVYACMTSSSLTNLEAWKFVGGFDESYFIDFVDNEFCMKLRLKSYRILRVNTCAISHQLGNSVEKRFLGKTWKGTSHKPWRLYYMMRNNVRFIKDYKANLNVPKEYVKIMYILYGELFFSGDRKQTLHYALNGLRDGLTNKKGKMK